MDVDGMDMVLCEVALAERGTHARAHARDVSLDSSIIQTRQGNHQTNGISTFRDFEEEGV